MAERQERSLERMRLGSNLTAPCLNGNTQKGGKAIRVTQGLLEDEVVWEVLLYMCCFYWLVNKEIAFGQWLNRI